MKLLFVCLGNICRSPLAAGIMKQLLYEKDIDGAVESAGTEDWNVGLPADKRAIKVARMNGIDLKSHRARQLTREDFDRFDTIVVMDGRIENSVRKLAPQAAQHKIKYMSRDLNGQQSEILDPYFSDERAFHELYEVLANCCRQLLKDSQGKP